MLLKLLTLHPCCWELLGSIIVSETSHTALDVFYLYSNHLLRLLAILCQGLVDAGGDPVYDPRVLLWSTAEKVSNIMPNAAEPTEEVI